MGGMIFVFLMLVIIVGIFALGGVVVGGAVGIFKFLFVVFLALLGLAIIRGFAGYKPVAPPRVASGFMGLTTS